MERNYQKKKKDAMLSLSPPPPHSQRPLLTIKNSISMLLVHHFDFIWEIDHHFKLDYTPSFLV